MLLVGRFSEGYHVSPVLALQCCPTLISLHPHWLLNLYVKSHLNLSITYVFACFFLQSHGLFKNINCCHPSSRYQNPNLTQMSTAIGPTSEVEINVGHKQCAVSTVLCVRAIVMPFIMCWNMAFTISKPAHLPPRLTGFNPRPGHSGFLHVGIVPDYAAGRWVFSGNSHFPSTFIPALHHTHLNNPSLALKTLLLGAT
ncbi:hypothetical protein PR048_013300 [Dryococelus australis]|uniref:Uncharacterized protein n=1 Tax=Dryococelus australis TaxID=614101 RepID=A0ABQ9HRS2_9NEOP|nr:hypothetical protein PR048_013300 [Dryococelus australis]